MSGGERILVVGGIWPHVQGNEQAAEVVTHEILRALASGNDAEIRYLCISIGRVPVTEAAEAGRRHLESLGIRFFPPLELPPLHTPSSSVERWWRMLVRADPSLLLPGYGHSDAIRQRLDGWRPDAVATVWTEVGTAAVAELGIPVYAYYGNPDHKSHLARSWFNWRIGGHPLRPGSLVRFAKALLVGRALERAHLAVMRRLHAVADVAANDAAYYQRHGVNAAYVRNMWVADARPAWEAARDRAEQVSPLKIVGNVGSLAATGNSFGLHTLATAILPALKRRLGEGAFEIHLFGPGKPHPAVAPLLADPHFKLRGYVADLDGEMVSAPVFLVANNHDVFKVGHTRFLHCWSLGGCAVGFKDSAVAMPEIRHRENALLGATPEEVAELVAEAAADVSLRRAIGRGGLRTLETLFRPDAICREIAASLRAIARREAVP
ncbi:MAG: hypothetical protein IRZ04_13625 [Rhodospirillales bacterium]|nr:hypothetical protein [Rhodospirillales bacterium]